MHSLHAGDVANPGLNVCCLYEVSLLSSVVCLLSSAAHASTHFASEASKHASSRIL